MRYIVLIAIKHKNYGKMANNLLASIHKQNPETPCIVITDKDVVSTIRIDRLVNTNCIIINPEQTYKLNGKDYFGRMKLLAYKYLPSDATEFIFIDADSFITPTNSLNTIKFDNLLISKDPNFPDSREINGVGKYAYIKEWASKELIQEVIKHFSPKVYHTNYYYNQGSMFGGKLTPEVIKFYDTAVKIHDFIITKGNYKGWIKDAIPDELCFSISLMINNMTPTLSTEIYSGWQINKIQEVLKKTILTFACGSNTLPGPAKTLYNQYARYYSKYYGLIPYEWIDKKYFTMNLPIRK